MRPMIPGVHISVRKAAILGVAIVFLAVGCVAQQQQQQNPTSTPQVQPVSEQTVRDAGLESTTPQPGTSNDRLFFAMPNFLTVRQTAGIEPLSSAEKFRVVARGSFDYFQGAWYGALAGISQAENSEPSFGQGMSGYAKRYGTAAADGTIEDFMTGAVLPSVLHQDPRYFQSGQGGFWRRTGYAMSRIVVTRSDSGRTEFNFSEIVGSAMSAGISDYTYHPRADRTLANTAQGWGTQIGYDTLTIVLKEFWPDLRRKMHKSYSEGR